MSDVRGTIAIPEAEAKVEHTGFEAIDKAVEEVAANRKVWVDTTIDERIDLLRRMIDTTMAVADAWATSGAEAKRIPEGDPNRGEDWTNGPTILVRQLKLLELAHEQIKADGAPKIPGKVTARPDGQLVVPAFPANVMDRLLMPLMTAEVWLDPSATTVRQARIHQPGGKDEGGVCLVLGAGNVSSIAPTDAISKLFNDDRVVVLKMNPVNEYVGPYLEQALAPLVEGGFLRFVYGGTAEGKHVTAHLEVDEIHITGSDKTFDAIVFGTGAEGATRKAADDPVWTKPISSELGNVTPIVVVPGPWSDADVKAQAVNIAGMLLHNAGFNCIAGRLIVTHKKWAKRQMLIDEVKKVLASATERFPYYPGARDRWEAFTQAHTDFDAFGNDGPDCVPWTFLNNLDASDTDATAFTTESFNGIMGEVALDSDQDVSAFIADAVDFCNDVAWGTLGVNVIAHPRTIKGEDTGPALEQALADLRYGTVALNIWCGLGFAFMTTTWGAFPGHERTDIQSGSGVVHNTLMLEDAQKTVIRAPFRAPLKGLTDPTHKTLHKLGPLLPAAVGLGDPKVLPMVSWYGIRA